MTNTADTVDMVNEILKEYVMDNDLTTYEYVCLFMQLADRFKGTEYTKNSKVCVAVNNLVEDIRNKTNCIESDTITYHALLNACYHIGRHLDDIRDGERVSDTNVRH